MEKVNIFKSFGERISKIFYNGYLLPDPTKIAVSGLKKPEVVFFIVGHPKSGTTWLCKILDNHPKISCRFEGHFFFREDGYNTLSNALRSSVDLRQWANRDFNLWCEDFDSDISYYIKLLIQFYIQREAQRTGKPIIGDKSPSYQMTEMALLFPKSKVIHIIRDGRDVAVSMAFHRSKETNRYMLPDMIKELDNRIASSSIPNSLNELPDDYVAHIANTWKTEVQTCQQQGKNLFGKNYFEIKYEDLHTNPEPVVKEILYFLSTDRRPEIVKICIEKADFKIMSGGREKGVQNHRSFFRKGIVGDWRNVFSKKNLSTFNRFAGKLLAELKYGN